MTPIISVRLIATLFVALVAFSGPALSQDGTDSPIRRTLTPSSTPSQALDAPSQTSSVTTSMGVRQIDEATNSLEKLESSIEESRAKAKSTLDFQWQFIEAQAESINRIKMTARDAFPQRPTEAEAKSRVSQAKEHAAKEIQKSRAMIPELNDRLSAERQRAASIDQRLSAMLYDWCPNGNPFDKCGHFDLRDRFTRECDHSRTALRACKSRIRQLEGQLANADRPTRESEAEVEAAGERQAEEDSAFDERQAAVEAAINELQKSLTKRIAKFKEDEVELARLDSLHTQLRLARAAMSAKRKALPQRTDEDSIDSSWIGLGDLVVAAVGGMGSGISRFASPSLVQAPFARAVPEANWIVGTRRVQMKLPRGVRMNTAGVANGRAYSAHGFDRNMLRGVTPTVVENTIAVGEKSAGKFPGTLNFFDPINRVGVVIDEATGRVITVK
ncbi:hypothetical protein V5E97_24810 [Singulisphaera sp. Ch08]|uniref:Uncharacterized protein n=1 Tax=Singulisphaera sp. Ch08 TaxID=3120278 RepID=A0AAU7C8W0_9BACT